MKSGTKGRVSTKRGEGEKNMEAASDCWKQGAHAPCNMCGWWRQVFNGQRPAAAPFPPRRAPSPRRRHSAQRVATTTAPSRPTGPCTVVTSALPGSSLLSLFLDPPRPLTTLLPKGGSLAVFHRQRHRCCFFYLQNEPATALLSLQRNKGEFKENLL